MKLLKEKINLRIEYLLDKDNLIWYSYFLKVKNLEELKIVFYNEIIPLLEEYFYWEYEKIKLVLWKEFFKKKNINKNLFENKNDFDEDENENQYEINKDLENDDFIKAIQNIIISNEQS